MFTHIKPIALKPHICFIGKLTFVKGGDRVIELFRKIKRFIPKSKLLIIGDKTQYCELSDDILCLGWMPRHKLPEVLKHCLICVHPARFDAFPVSILEAMAAGIIPVVTPTTGTADVIARINKDLIAPYNEMASALVNLLRTDKSKLLSLSMEYKEAVQSFRSQVEEELYSFFSKCNT